MCIYKAIHLLHELSLQEHSPSSLAFAFRIYPSTLSRFFAESQCQFANDLQRQAKLGKIRKRVVRLGRNHQVGLVGDGRGEGRRSGEGES